MKRRQQAAEDYTNGKIESLAAMVSRQPPATFFGPGGGKVDGPREVLADYEKGAQMFEPGGQSKLQIVHMAAGDEFAYWVGIQHATARMRGKDEPTPFELRITEILRRERQEWKLFHRHADMLAKPKD